MIYFIFIFIYSCSSLNDDIKSIPLNKTETLLEEPIFVEDSLIEKVEYYKNGNIRLKYFVNTEGLKHGLLVSYSEETGKVKGTTNYENGERKGDKYIYDKLGKKIQYYSYVNDTVYTRMRKYDENEIFFTEFRKNNDTTFFGNHLIDTVIYSKSFLSLWF